MMLIMRYVLYGFSMLGYKKQEWMENVPLYASMEYIRSKE